MSRGAALCALGSVRICISVICFLSTITQKRRRHMVAVLRHKRKTKAERRIRSPSPREPPPSPREEPGRGPYFFNTEDTDVTENHPAHFDNTDAASRQLMTRNLRTHITGHQNSACPTARASPAPWGGPGRGSICVNPRAYARAKKICASQKSASSAKSARQKPLRSPPREPHPPLGEGRGGAPSA